MANPSRAFEFLRLWPGLPADPGSGLPGEIYFNSTSNSLRYFDGSVWTNFGGTWADQQLSNLFGVTAIPVDLLPDITLSHDIGSALKSWNNLFASALNTVSSISDVVGSGMTISSQPNTGAFSSGALNVLTGTVVDGTSGTIALATGAATGTGSRGVISMSAASVNLQLQTPLHFGAFTSSNYVAFKAPGTIASSLTWTLPATDGAANNALTTDGFGNLGWSPLTSSLYVLRAGDTMTGGLNLPTINVNGGQFQQLNNAQMNLKGVMLINDINATAFPGYLSFIHAGGAGGGAYVGIDDVGLANLSPGNLILMGNTGTTGVAIIPASVVKLLVAPSVTTTFQAIVPNAAATLDLGSNSLYYNNLWANNVQRQAQAVIGGGGQTLPSGASSGYGINDFAVASLATIALWTSSNNAATASATGTVRLESGNKTAGTGNSGDIKIRIGTSSGGTRGSVYLTDGSESLGAGAVWTLQDTLGRGKWVASSTPVGVTPNVVYHTVSSGEITAKQLTLSSAPVVPANTMIDIIGGDAQAYAVDYTVSGTTLSWSGLGLDGFLTAGDVLRIVWFT